VQFIVQAVDDILKKEFELTNGLADNSKIPDHLTYGFKCSSHKVQILDPAAGTGTFLAEVINKIYSSFANQKGMWSGYCEEHLIPRLNGFEILMASYTMAHFKLAMTLNDTGYTGEANSRLRVYLTNTLDEPENVAINLPMVEWLTAEANEANNIKKDTPVMVILGNPPYSGESSNFSKTEFLESYKKEPGGIEKLNEKNPKWINDDYVKFIRFGQNFIEKYGDGVLAFINNHSFLDNPTFRGMRWTLLQTFDKIYILDLPGNARKKETAPDGSKDENVFDIRQGVSINLFIKTSKKKDSKFAEVFHTDLYGERRNKYTFLLENTIQSIKWKKIKIVSPYYFFVHKDYSGDKEYKNGFSVHELFPLNSVGIVTARDNFTIHETAQQIKNTIKDFISLDIEKARTRFNLGKDARDWTVAGARKDLIPNPDKNPNPDFNNIVHIQYRPFDTRFTYYTGNSKGFHCMPRGKVMRHFLFKDNIGLIFTRSFTESAPPIFISDSIIDSRSWSRPGMQGVDYVSPLYLYPDNDTLDQTETRRPNLNTDIVNLIASRINLQFTDEKLNDKKTFAPIDIMDYIYAVLHSPAYRTKYKEFLRIDFPRVPYPVDCKQFMKLASFGEILRKIHLLENVTPSAALATYPKEGSNTIDNLSYREKKVWINKNQYFDNVPQHVWEFYIGGYQPARKWLKDRKGRILTYDDIQHYQKIVNALSLTADVQEHIDGVVGGVFKS
jgi:predicted helicase